MAYTDLAPYLSASPQGVKTDRSNGTIYQYRVPSSVYSTYPVAIQSAWADGRPVQRVSESDVSESGYIDVTVETSQTWTPVTLSTTTEGDPRYELNWQANDLPLWQHPAFLPGGSSDLNATASGSPTRTHRADVIGWENESDLVLRSARQYKMRDSNGNAYGSAITLAGAALAYVKLRELGFESYTVHLPVWSKISRYRGSDTPGVGTIGQYVAGSSVPSLPSDLQTDYQWIKITDNAARNGVTLLWERNEAWQGFKKVYYDVDDLNPAGNSLP